MRFLIIGLGIYGSNLAIKLTQMGHEVIGADSSPSLVDSIKDLISTAYIIDSTDETAIAALPLNNVDLVIVAIGENFGASIRTVAILKKLRVKNIYARAIDQLHESILESFDIQRILTPEQRAADDLVNEMGIGGANVESMSVDDSNYILKFRVPEMFVGLRYADLDLLSRFSLKLIAVTRPITSRNLLGIARPHPEMMANAIDPESDVVATAGDIMLCLGTEKAFHSLFHRIHASD